MNFGASVIPSESSLELGSYMAGSQVCTWPVRYRVLHGQRIQQHSLVPALLVDPR